MSTRDRRRPRQAPPVKVKVAFGGDDDDDDNDKQNNREIAEENPPTELNQLTEKKNGGEEELNRNYERAFFTIHNVTVEVVLDNDILSWATITGDASHEELNRRKPIPRDPVNSVNIQNVFAVTPIHTHWNWSINNSENVAGTTVSTSNTISSPGSTPASNLSLNSVFRGFQLHSYQPLPDNILQEILIIFQSNDSQQIERWYRFLIKITSEFRTPRNVLVLCNPYAGSRISRHIYNTKIKPLLEKAQFKITYLEIDDHCGANEVLAEFHEEFDLIHSLVIVGGDGSVINVINALIRYVAKQNRIGLDMEHDLPSIPFPLCIVPNGTTNLICHSIHGNVDHCTPIFHLLFNQKIKIDMSAIFDNDYHFVTSNFSAGAGYPANVLKYFPRYSLHSPKTVIKKSFSKAASNKNLQPLEIEIRYIPASQNNPSGTRCYRGCPSCTPLETEKTDDQVQAFDDFHVQKISRRKKSSASTVENNARLSSSARSSLQKVDKEKNWKTIHQNFLQVAVFTNANLWTFAPQGLSKFGHLADGLLDLILVEPVNRKEFLRYIKRNGNSKNQYEFLFTKIIKVKEIEIELKSPVDEIFNEITNTDNQPDSSLSDDSSNEDTSDNENKPSASSKRHQPHPPSAPITADNRRQRHLRHRINEQTTQESSPHVLQSSKSMDGSVLHWKNRPSQQQSESEMDSPQADPYGSATSLRRSGIFQSLKSKKEKVPLPRPSSALGGDPDDGRAQRRPRKSVGGTLRPARSFLNLLTRSGSASSKGDKLSKNLSRETTGSDLTRKPSVLGRSSSMDNPKASTGNDSPHKKRPCMWNLDFSPYNSPLIRMKCFYRYLSVYGIGLDPETKLKEMNYSCFGRMG